MTVQAVNVPFTVYPDRSGVPLTGGRIYIGVAGANPVTNSVATYFDAALTVPAAQPILTSGGYAQNGNSMAQIYVGATDYSILVLTATGQIVYSRLSSNATFAIVDIENLSGNLPSDRIEYERTAAEISAGVTPADLSIQPGIMPRYSTVADALAQLSAGGAPVELEPGETYTISSKMSMTSVTGFTINGRGATIKAADGMSVASNTQLLHLTDCERFEITDLLFDGNRANRTPAEVSSHLLQITGCRQFAVRRSRADNATTDGFRLDAQDVTDADTYCRDFLFEGCSADNAYRLGAGIINARDGIFIGGAFTGSVGTAPQAGADVESNDNSVDPGNRSVRFIGVRFTGNTGFGLVLSGKDAAHAQLVDGCYFSDNDDGGISCSAGATIVNSEFADFSVAGAIGIDIGASANARVKIVNNVFRNFVGTGPCIDDGSTTAYTQIQNNEFLNVAQAVTSDGSRVLCNDNEIDTCTGIGISVTGNEGSLCNNRVRAATGRGIFCTGTSMEISGNWVIDIASVSGAYIQAEGAGNLIQGNVCSAASAQATTIGIRANFDCTAIVFNRCVNLHTTQPYSIQGTESNTGGMVAFNGGGTSNFARRSRLAFGAGSFSDGSRPAATVVPIGAQIWNTTDNAPNFSDGTDWRTAAGVVT